MPAKEVKREYPLIDSDPYFGRVMRYMRSSDYGVWAAATAGGPLSLWLYEKMDPTKSTPRALRASFRLTGFLGFAGGFLLAYQRSSFRFWGWTENAEEVAKDQRELSARAAAGKPIYGESDLTPYLQGVAARNSTWSQLKLATFPWFNVANHNSHGVDTSKYTNETPNQPS